MTEQGAGDSIHLDLNLPDELQFCDPDIQEAYRGKNYFVGLPTQTQLSHDLRRYLDTMAGFPKDQ